MGCDSQFDDIGWPWGKRTTNRREFESEIERASFLIHCDRNQIEFLKSEIAKIEEKITLREPNLRGYTRDGEQYVCLFDQTVTNSMDGHDQVCTKPRVGRNHVE